MKNNNGTDACLYCARNLDHTPEDHADGIRWVEMLWHAAHDRPEEGYIATLKN